MGFYDEALEITERAIKRVMPGQAVKKALEEMNFKKLRGDADNGKVVIIAIGKAAWQIAKAAKNWLESAEDRTSLYFSAIKSASSLVELSGYDGPDAIISALSPKTSDRIIEYTCAG